MLIPFSIFNLSKLAYSQIIFCFNLFVVGHHSQGIILFTKLVKVFMVIRKNNLSIPLSKVSFLEIYPILHSII